MSVNVWVGLGFFLSLLTSSYDAMNMFFYIEAGGEQFVHCREVVHSLECPLSEFHCVQDEVWLSEQTRTFRVEVCALHKLPIIEFRR